jgi:hypothetical protein
MPISTSVISSSRLSLLTLFGAAVIGGVVWANRTRLNKVRTSSKEKAEEQRDQTLQDSFPASDAPATRDYAIPVNAR